MSASTRLIHKHLKSTKKILLHCQVVADGVGDFYHLVDLAKNKDNILSDFGKDIIVASSQKEDMTSIFKMKMEKLGFKTIIIKKSEDFQAAFEITSTPMAYIFERNTIKNDKRNLELIKNNYIATISVSVASSAKDAKLPTLDIAGHAGISPELLSVGRTYLAMNLSSKGTQSIFLDQENRDHPEKQLETILLKPDNQEIREALFGKKQVTPDLCQRFLADTLFIPCYFQHKASMFIDFLNIVQESPLTKKFQNTIFFVNKINVDLLKKACQQGVISKRIGNITIQTPTETTEIENLSHDKNNLNEVKPVKFVVGFRVNDDEDYSALFHCAQYFAGASGDKTLEKVLSNGLIPLFIPHTYDKENFMDAAAEVFPLFKILPNYHFHRLQLYPDNQTLSELKTDNGEYIILKNPSEEAKKIDESFFLEWQKLCERLKNEYNLHNKLPALVDKILLPQIEKQQFIYLISQPNIDKDQIKAFLDELSPESFRMIEGYHNAALEDRNAKQILPIKVQYNMLKISPYFIEKSTLTVPEQAPAVFIAKILNHLKNPTLDDLYIAQKCLKDIIADPNQKYGINIPAANKILKEKFKKLGLEIDSESAQQQEIKQADTPNNEAITQKRNL